MHHSGHIVGHLVDVRVAAHTGDGQQPMVDRMGSRLRLQQHEQGPGVVDADVHIGDDQSGLVVVGQQ